MYDAIAMGTWSARLVLAAFALASSLAAAPQVHAQTADKLHAAVMRLYEAGKYAEAIPLAEKVVAMRERALGPDHPDVATSLNKLADLYWFQGRFGDAELLYRRSLDIREHALRPGHPDLGMSLNNLADLYRTQSRFGEAEPLYKRSLAIYEAVHGPQDWSVATILYNLAELYRAQGRYGKAELPAKRALAIYEKALGPEHRHVAMSLSSLALLYRDQGRYGEAEPLARRALTIHEKSLGAEHPDVATSLSSMAELYRHQGRYGEAEPLYRRALTIHEKALGPENPFVASSLSNLAGLYWEQGRSAEAEPLFKRALAIREKALGPEHPSLAASLSSLAGLYRDQRRSAEAEPLAKRALTINERALGAEHPDVATSLSRLAWVYRDQGRFDEAEPLYTRTLTIRERTLGPEHPNLAMSLSSLAWLYVAQRDWARAAEHWRRATGIIARRVLLGTSRGSLGETEQSEAGQKDWYFRGLVKVSHARASEENDHSPAMAREMFETAQWVQSSHAASSLAQMAARGAVGDPTLAALVRERQDLVAEWQAKDRLRIAALSQPQEQRNAKAQAETAARLAAVDKRLAEIDARLARDFADFAVLTSPAPISVSDVQALLGPDEALVLFLDTDDIFRPLPAEAFIWVVSKDKVQWAKSDIGTKDLAEKVARFRMPLDLWARVPRALARLDASSTGCAPVDTRGLARADAPCTQSTQFSLALAHELYAKLLGPVAGAIKDKQHLILVPSGPLTGLPFNALLTEPPPGGKTTLAAMKGAPWIVRKHAITILPSASSLRALRRSAKASGAAKPFVGFGNPDFRGKGKSGETRVATRGVSDYFRGALADVETLRGALPPLPDTADELKAIATTLAASESDIVLGPKASEATVKAMSGAGTLAAYKVVAFATHGLVAGQLKGLAEPAIALTVPEKASEADDGLLTASEAAALKLDADWVLLSACNTAAGGEPGAEALSGLSRAFFYAGTRALLVSHWEVESSAAVRLTTGTFAALKANPALGRSQAFRRSMLDLIDNGAPHEAHPAYWAPFFVVGEGK